MPDRDGSTLMTQLRTTRPNLQGIARNGYSMESDVAKSRRAGFSAHLTKPVNVASLEQALETLLNQRDATSA